MARPRLVIDNDDELVQAETALLAIETTAYDLAGWFMDASGLDEVQARIEKAIDRYELHEGAQGSRPG